MIQNTLWFEVILFLGFMENGIFILRLEVLPLQILLISCDIACISLLNS